MIFIFFNFFFRKKLNQILSFNFNLMRAFAIMRKFQLKKIFMIYKILSLYIAA